MGELTEQQIKNWRNVLSFTLGAYAFIMPVEQINAIRMSMQRQAGENMDGYEKETPSTVCECDPHRYGHTIHLDGSITCNKCNKIRMGRGIR